MQQYYVAFYHIRIVQQRIEGQPKTVAVVQTVAILAQSILLTNSGQTPTAATAKFNVALAMWYLRTYWCVATILTHCATLLGLLPAGVGKRHGRTKFTGPVVYGWYATILIYFSKASQQHARHKHTPFPW